MGGQAPPQGMSLNPYPVQKLEIYSLHEMQKYVCDVVKIGFSSIFYLVLSAICLSISTDALFNASESVLNYFFMLIFSGPVAHVWLPR